MAIQLSEIMGRGRTLSVSTISHWENGVKDPTYATMVALAELYGVTTQYISGESDSRTATESNIARPSVSQDTLEIPFNYLRKYDGQPVYIVFNNYQYENRWGICDYSNNKIQFANGAMKIDSKVNCSYYVLKPYFEDKYGINSSQPYDMAHMLSAKLVYVRMLSPDKGIQNAYEGWYHHNELKSCLINDNGLTLPYSGLGFGYNAYPTGKRD